jgi:hypothetical protein
MMNKTVLGLTAAMAVSVAGLVPCGKRDGGAVSGGSAAGGTEA